MLKICIIECLNLTKSSVTPKALIIYQKNLLKLIPKSFSKFEKFEKFGHEK